MKKVLIVGAGISGLSLFYRLDQERKKSGENYQIFLADGGERAGGILETERSGGFVLEKGPDAFITDKPWALELARELGLQDRLLATNTAHRRSFIARDGKLFPVPDGFYLIAPLDAAAFLRSPLFSIFGKMRMLLEPWVPARKGSSDESIASFIRRRFGAEALERAGQAMLAGIYTGDPEHLSLSAALPRFKEIENKYGSLTGGLLKENRQKISADRNASGPRYSLFVSFKEGMEELAAALASRVPAGSFLKNSAVQALRIDPLSKKWNVSFAGGRADEIFDEVCLTVPARTAGLILSGLSEPLCRILSGFRYESVATINLAFDRKDIAHPLNGFGFVVPKTESKALIACSFSSQKFAGRAPQGKVLLRAFVGGAFGKQHLELDDAALLKKVQAEISQYLGIQAPPFLTRLRRYPGAMIQYEVGHLDKIARIGQLLESHPGLTLTGSNYQGVGIPDCIRQTQEQALKIHQRLISIKESAQQ